MSFLNSGILGINARNMLYIRPYNRKKAIQFADNKLKTKLFLEARGIAVPRLYASIRDAHDLNALDWNSLPKNFVVKPNRGFGGEGILIVKNFIVTNQAKVTALKEHIMDILDGTFSLANAPDIAILEQVIVPHPLFKDYSGGGLPDVRIIVHNLIPVIAELRLPTKESQGKANLHQGGLGLGIDMATGKTTYGVQYDKPIHCIPNTDIPIKGLQIPKWDELLEIACRAQIISNLGYLAIDIVIDKNERPIVLELNARGGLAIQIANKVPLRQRLDRIKGLKVKNYKKGVLIGKELFGSKSIKIEKKPVLNNIVGSVEEIELITSQGARKMMASIEPNQEQSELTYSLAQELGLLEKEKVLNDNLCCKIEFKLLGKRLKTIVKITNKADINAQITVGKRDLRGFMIDPFKKPLSVSKDKERQKEMINSKIKMRKLDKIIADIDKQLHFLGYLRPLNLSAEKERFFATSGYNPIFQYRCLQLDIENLRNSLLEAEFDDSALGILLQKKAQETILKLELLNSIGNATAFTEKSILLYGKPDGDLLKLATERLASMPDNIAGKETFSALEVKDIFVQILQEYGIKNWNINIKKDMASDASIGKTKTIFIKSGAIFTAERLKGTIIHEIETHLLTAENSKYQSYRILNSGTANYLLTQEGLAVYNQEKLIPNQKNSTKYYGVAANVIGVQVALEGSFYDVYQRMRDLGFTEERAFKFAFKSKRGLIDTSQKGAFTKGILYAKGKQLIERFVAEAGDLKRLYIGRINVEDLSLIEKLPDIKEPKYVPKFLLEDKK